ncbi:hypothetical protein Vadar_033004 [Vaccinium darrowii]|uniref:Uncharacterized protein n=1 Tax=Vaccinium darrowii TaxID=229202 RepID=A0ACB7XV90_9ERIC|nr:hypothetical protein Vadar_033004 [Vaccinium darrowii]
MGLGHPIKPDGSDQINIRAGDENTRGSPDEPLQLDLHPVPRNQPPSELRLFPWLTHNFLSELGSSKGQGRGAEELNRVSLMAAEKRSEDGASVPLLSSPNSTTVSSILFQNQMDLSLNGRSKGDLEKIASICTNSDHCDTDQRGGADGSSEEEDDQNGSTDSTRKKLRLSKQQSAFLEDTFNEHNCLNSKQKQDMAKQLNLRPRQVEVWFQNRRARTKSKQTEVDCEYLKRCYETLTEENRRLQKEVQELKVLKTSQPFYNQLLPATTLTMCLSCNRGVASTAAAAAIDTTTGHWTLT